MSSPLRTATIATIRQVLATHQSIPLKNKVTLPASFAEGHGQLEGKFVFCDFKQAWSHFELIAQVCHQLNYHPQIFNVYNRVEVKLSTDKSVTVKDLYFAHFLHQLHSRTSDHAHEQALKQVQSIV